MTTVCQTHDIFTSFNLAEIRCVNMVYRCHSMVSLFSFKVLHAMLWWCHAYCHVCCPKHGCKCPNVKIIQLFWCLMSISSVLPRGSWYYNIVDWLCMKQTSNWTYLELQTRLMPTFSFWPLGWYINDHENKRRIKEIIRKELPHCSSF